MDFLKTISGITNMVTNLDKVRDSREEALNTKIGKSVIDTVLASDTDKWETGISINGESWVIVEQYSDKNEAEKGHKKYVAEIKKGKKDFKDINIWDLKD